MERRGGGRGQRKLQAIVVDNGKGRRRRRRRRRRRWKFAKEGAEGGGGRGRGGEKDTMCFWQYLPPTSTFVVRGGVESGEEEQENRSAGKFASKKKFF